MHANTKTQTLHQTLERTALEQLIEAFRNEEIDAVRVCKLFQAFCEFKKQDAVGDKNKTSIEVARLRYADPKTRAPAAPDPDESVTAPYGAKSTGEPYTRAEFLDTLGRTVRAIYGVNLFPPRTNAAAPAQTATPREPSQILRAGPCRPDPPQSLKKPDTKPP